MRTDGDASDTRHDRRGAARRCPRTPSAPIRATRTTAATLALGIALAAALGGCVQIHLLSYPAEFVWLDDEDVRGAMQLMAASVERLDLLVVPFEGLEASDAESLRRAVDEELALIEEIALALAAGVAPEGEPLPRTNHLLIDEHIDEFLADVARARSLVAAETPSYYAVGELVGSCTACHRYR